MCQSITVAGAQILYEPEGCLPYCLNLTCRVPPGQNGSDLNRWGAILCTSSYVNSTHFGLFRFPPPCTRSVYYVGIKNPKFVSPDSILSKIMLINLPRGFISQVKMNILSTIQKSY
jgi:hypothetical protein